MFSFIAPIVIFVSAVGIVVLVLRRTPELKQLPRADALKKLKGQGWARKTIGVLQLSAEKAWELLVAASKRLWKFVLEVKEVSTPGLTNIPRKMGRRLSSGKLPFFGTTDTPGYHLKKAKQNLAEDDFQRAEDEFIKVIEKDHQNEDAYAGLGVLYLNHKKFTEASETYKYLTKLNPDKADYYSGYGQALMGLARDKKAAAAFQKALDLDAGNPEHYANLGQALAAVGDREGELKNLRQAVKMEPNNTHYLLLLAESLTAGGDKESAVEILEQILRIEPTNSDARKQLMHLKY